jgi:hypothetical protein
MEDIKHIGCLILFYLANPVSSRTILIVGTWKIIKRYNKTQISEYLYKIKNSTPASII